MKKFISILSENRVFTGKIILLSVFCCAVSFGILTRASAQTENSEEKSLRTDYPLSIPGKSPDVKNLHTEKSSESVASRIEKGELPFSRLREFLKPSPEKTLVLPELDESEFKDSADDKKLRVGTLRTPDKAIAEFSEGESFSVENGKVWLLEVQSVKAVRMRLQFENMNLPEGASVFVYSAANPDDVYKFERTGDGEKFWTPPVQGDRVVVEYFAPEATGQRTAKLPFRITAVSHIFRDPLISAEGCEFAPPDQPCHINVPAEWTELAKSVGYLEFVDGGSEYICTGTLLNSVSGDFYPIMLTANHCFDNQASAQSLRAYWAYNSGDFPSGSIPFSDRANLLSTNPSSDYTLVQILGSLPVRANQVSWTGWNAAAPASGTAISGIHHPNGSYKRFSIGSVITGFCIIQPCQNFIPVRYSQGTTEGGSSGSGLWTGTGTAARFVGTLTGGESGCGIRDSFGSFAVTYQGISSFLQGGGDDSFDNANGNDARNNASVVSASAAFSDLVVKHQDEDWYRISVAAGTSLTVTANFTNSYGNIDLQLYRGAETSPVASAASSSSNTETINFTNNSGSTQTFDIRVFLYDGARNTYNLSLNFQPGTVSQQKTPFDFDGDGRADLSVFRPSEGNWYINQSTNGFTGIAFGTSTDVLTPADYDGDGKTDIAVFRNGFWYILRSSLGFAGFQFGASGDIPVPADYTGDGRAEIAVFRGGAWYILNIANNQFSAVQFGVATDKPVPGDYDGDTKADVAVVRQASGASSWYILGSTSGFYGVQFGADTDKLVPADYDGDGKTDQAVFRNGFWYINRSQAGFTGVQFGLGTDVPAPADYTGDGKADVAVYRGGNWYMLSSSTSAFSGQAFGAGSDKPVPAAFVR